MPVGGGLEALLRSDCGGGRVLLAHSAFALALVCASPDTVSWEEASLHQCCQQLYAAHGACSLSAAALLTGYEEGEARVTFEGCPQSLMDTVVHFLHVERTKLREAAVDRAATAAEAAAAGGSSSSSNGQVPAAAGGGSRDADEQAPGPAANGLQLDYQRKVTPSERAVLLADVLDDAFEAAAAAAAAAAGEACAQDQAGIACFGQTQGSSSLVLCVARACFGSCLVCQHGVPALTHSPPCSFAPGPQSAYQSCCVLLSRPVPSCLCALLLQVVAARARRPAPAVTSWWWWPAWWTRCPTWRAWHARQRCWAQARW